MVTSSPSGYTTTGTRASFGCQSLDIFLTYNSLVNRDALMEGYIRLMQNMLRSTLTIKRRAKSVHHSKNLGTIKNRKTEKQQTVKEDSPDEVAIWTCGLQFMIIGLIRSDRNGTSYFIVQRLRTLSELQAEQ